MNAIKAPRDFWTGMVYLVVGGVGLLAGRDYAFGSAGRMGPGYFPTIISWLLVGFAAISFCRSLQMTGPPVDRIAVPALLLVVSSTIAFGLLLAPAGFVIALIVSVLLAARASRLFAFNWIATAGLATLAAFCALVFVRGLGVPMPLIGSWFGW